MFPVASTVVRLARLSAWLLVFLLMLLALAQPSAAQAERKHCEICGRFWDSSPSRIEFTLTIGRHQTHAIVCGPYCYSQRMEKHPDLVPTSATIVNYPEYQDRFGGTIALAKAIFLYGIQGDPELSAEPYVAAFRSRDEAKRAQAKLGGELLGWDEVYKRCKKLAAQDDPPQQDDAPGRRPH